MTRRLKNPRSLAAAILTDVIGHGATLDTALARYNVPASVASDRNRALIQEMAFGCMRWYHLLDAIVHRLLERKLKNKDLDIQMLIVVGLYQLLYLSTRDHAAVSETVAATRDLGKPWAKGLVNACLRHFQRQQTRLLESIKADLPDIEFSHPRWMLDEFKHCWPERWPELATANNQRPPMHLRANLARATRDELMARLGAGGIASRPLATKCGIALEHPVPVDKLPGFANGELSVQDQSAQYAALLLDPQPGEKLLDACAAPGGKTCHLLEQVGGEARLLAIEIDRHRADRIRENLQRTGLEAEIKIADAGDPAGWWDGQAFDRILLDAPCSATGVIRRHPDIKCLREPSDIDRLVSIQAGLLEALWPLLGQGGKLLYATCSIIKRENELQIEPFLNRHADAREVPLAIDDDAGCRHGAQLLPGVADGFYYCLLEKL